MGKQCIGLEHRVDRPLISLRRRNVFATDQDVSLSGLLQPCYEPKRRGLATTAWPEQGKEGSSRNV